MWLLFPLLPFVILAPAVVIGGLMVFTLLAVPVGIIIILAGTGMVVFERSRLVVRSAKQLRQVRRANRQRLHADADVGGAVGAPLQDLGAEVDRLPQPGLEFD